MMGRRRKTDLEPRPAPKPKPQPAKIAECDARCGGCQYSGMIFRNETICEYLDLRKKRHMRPCPAGAECTVYEPRKAPRAKTPPIWQKLMKEDKENG